MTISTELQLSTNLRRDNKNKGETEVVTPSQFTPKVSKQDQEALSAIADAIPLWQLQGTGNKRLPASTVNVFCDYLRFFSAKCELSYSGLELIKNLFLLGRFYLNSQGCKGKTEFEIKVFDCSGQVFNGSSKTWTYCIENTLGIRLYVSDNGNFIDAIQLEFSGNPLSQIFPRNSYLLLCETIKIMKTICPSINVSRFDATIECSHDVLDILEIRSCANKGEIYGFKTSKEIVNRSWVKVDKKQHYVINGLSVYFGSKKTRNKKFVIYETHTKHGYHGVRLELRLGDNHSRLFVDKMMALWEYHSEDLAKDSYIDHNVRNVKIGINTAIRTHFINWILSANTICFIQKDKKRHNRGIWSQYEQIVYEFWDKFRSELNTTKYEIKFQRQETPLQRKIRWYQRTVTNFHLALKDYFGREGLAKIIDDCMAIAQAKEHSSFGGDRFKGITGITDSYRKTMSLLIDAGDNPWLSMLDDCMQDCLRGLNLLHSYPRIFEVEGVVFPIFKNKNSELYQSTQLLIS